MTDFNSEPEREMQEALRKHWKAKYKTMEVAAGFLDCSPQFLCQIGKGKKWPPARILKDAGIVVVVQTVRNVSWSMMEGRKEQ